MPTNFQFGHEQYLYIACGHATDADDWNPIALDGKIGAAGATSTINDVKWGNVAGTSALDFSNIRDVSLQGNENTVDATTRDEARDGVTFEPITGTSYQLTFDARWKPQSSSGTPRDKILKALLRAAALSAEIGALALDNVITTDGALGYGANWTVSITKQEPVQGVVVASLSLRSTTFFQAVEAQDALANNFAALALVP